MLERFFCISHMLAFMRNDIFVNPAVTCAVYVSDGFLYQKYLLVCQEKKISIYAVFTFYSFWTVILYSRTMFKLSLMELVYQEFFTFWFCANIFLILVICRKIVAHKVCYILFLLSEWLENEERKLNSLLYSLWL